MCVDLFAFLRLFVCLFVWLFVWLFYVKVLYFLYKNKQTNKQTKKPTNNATKDRKQRWLLAFKKTYRDTQGVAFKKATNVSKLDLWEVWSASVNCDLQQWHSAKCLHLFVFYIIMFVGLSLCYLKTMFVDIRTLSCRYWNATKGLERRCTYCSRCTIIKVT